MCVWGDGEKLIRYGGGLGREVCESGERCWRFVLGCKIRWFDIFGLSWYWSIYGCIEWYWMCLFVVWFGWW